MHNFIWFKTDLRIQDNKLLERASTINEKFIGIYILDPLIFRSSDNPSVRISFIVESIFNLKSRLEELGSTLLIIESDPVKFWESIALKAKTMVLTSEDYTDYSVRRDKAVQKIITNNLGTFESIKNNVVYDNEDGLLTNEQNPIKVFTRFKIKWLDKIASDKSVLSFSYNPKLIFETKDEIDNLQIKQTDIEVLKGMIIPGEFKGGEDQALEQWNAFKTDKIFEYNTTRNNLSTDGTSRLSPHFKWGTLSIHKAVRDCLGLLKSELPYKTGVESYLSELIWREFYKYILAYYPEVQKNNFNPKYDNVSWDFNEELFQAWCEGKTGYPVVDACMRQLNQTGWMHNRGRMIVGSFLCKDLHIHWKYGEKYFKQHLVDLDISSNNGGWQWVAGTGTDAAPYFRIFNPTEQGKKFDPKGDFIKKYVKELRDVPTNYIHEPKLMSILDQVESNCTLGKDYPLPIIDHKVERNRALELYKSNQE